MSQRRDNIVSFRLSDDGFAAVEHFVKSTGVERTTVIRTMMAIAQSHERELVGQLRLIAASQNGAPSKRSTNVIQEQP